MTVHSIELDSRAEEVERLLGWADPLLAATGLDEMASFNFRCALVEVVNNCIRHAYDFEPGHPVEVRFELQADEVTAVVRDRGPEFKPPGETSTSELTAESGRGFEIIRAWVDEVDFDRAGGWNICRLVRRLA